jgi:hypothetical protein
MKKFHTSIFVLSIALTSPLISGNLSATNAPPAHTTTAKHANAASTATSATSSEQKPASAAGNAESLTAPLILPSPSLPHPSIVDLQSTGSSLPLLSVIGFGILVGGILSALRTRPVHK